MKRDYHMFRAPLTCWITGVVLALAFVLVGPTGDQSIRFSSLSKPGLSRESEEAMPCEGSHPAYVASQPALSVRPEVSIQHGNRALEEDSERILKLRAWCEEDPEAMTAWVVTHLAGSDRVTAIKQAAVVWFSVDPDSAIRWVGSLVEDAERNAALLEIGFEMARLKPENAVELASKLPDSPMRDELVVHSVRQWAGMDLSAASAWASVLPESPLRQEVFSALAVSLAVESGEDAAVVVARSISAGKEQQDSAVLVARSWGTLDPEAAADWTVGFQDTLVREAAMREILATWSERSPERMYSWIGSLGDELIRLQLMEVVESARRHSGPEVQESYPVVSP